MGRTATSSQEDIFSAADALVAAGKTPTLLALREALGGGSMSTLSQALTLWRQNRSGASMPEVSVPDLPLALKTLLDSIGRSFWSEAVALAGRDLQSIREQADKAAGESRQRLCELEEALAVLEQERDRLEESLSSLQTDIVQAQAEREESLVTLARETGWRDGKLQQMEQEISTLKEILKAQTALRQEQDPRSTNPERPKKQ
ncbi:MAG: DNA-binding protein [Leptospirales bacterium]